MLDAIVEEFGLEGMYSEDMVGLKRFIFVFDKFFEEKLPTLRQHFANCDISEHMWVGKWIMTLFVNSFPKETVIRLWDCFFVKGMPFVYRVVLGLLKKLEDLLLVMDEGELAGFFGKLMNGGGKLLPPAHVLV
jgi:ABC-type microcin C transport system permease subunit YejB